MTDKDYRTGRGGGGQFAINCKAYFSPQKRGENKSRKQSPPIPPDPNPLFLLLPKTKKQNHGHFQAKPDPESTAKWQLTHLLRVDHLVLLQVLRRRGGLGGGPGRGTVGLWFGGPGPGLLRTARGLRLDEVVFFRFLLPRVVAVVLGVKIRGKNSQSRQKKGHVFFVFFPLPLPLWLHSVPL